MSVTTLIIVHTVSLFRDGLRLALSLVRAVRDERSADAAGGPEEGARSSTPDGERAPETAAESAAACGEGTDGDRDPRG